MADMYEYRYKFCVDEEIVGRYDCIEWQVEGFVFETRINFTVKGICGERITIDSERFEYDGDDEPNLRHVIGKRLKDCWMPRPQIRTMIHQFMLFARKIRASGHWGKIIPVAADLEICTVQRDGEAMAAALERAMRPEILPPLYLYSGYTMADSLAVQLQEQFCEENTMNDMEKITWFAIRVEDAEKAMCIMDLCSICGRKPSVGTRVSKLEYCGHTFHYHCIARRLLEETNNCPICHHGPVFAHLTIDDLFHEYRAILADYSDPDPDDYYDDARQSDSSLVDTDDDLDDSNQLDSSLLNIDDVSDSDDANRLDSSVAKFLVDTDDDSDDSNDSDDDDLNDCDDADRLEDDDLDVSEDTDQLDSSVAEFLIDINDD